MKIPQPNHSFKRRVPAPRERASMENVVNGVKTIMVNGRLRTGPSVASPVVPLVTPPVCSLVLRRGDSCGDTKPSRTGRSNAVVSVWAWAKRASNATSARISARHGDTARKDLARLRRPLAGPEITMKIPQPNHSFKQRVPAPRERASMEIVVNGVKTIMVNGRLRTAPSVASTVRPC